MDFICQVVINVHSGDSTMELELYTILHYYIEHKIWVYTVIISPELVLITREISFSL